MKTLFNLPKKVIFCKKCVMSNQRPASVPEFRHTRNRDGAKYMKIDSKGVCDACNQAATKKLIDWDERERELKDLLDKHRSNNGQYDCLVPGSGGKDSVFQAHILKYKYGMHPLTCTWPPILYTDYGFKNFKNWINIGGFDNLSYNQNGKAMKLLTKLSIENLLHPFQTFILGHAFRKDWVRVCMPVNLEGIDHRRFVEGRTVLEQNGSGFYFYKGAAT